MLPPEKIDANMVNIETASSQSKGANTEKTRPVNVETVDKEREIVKRNDTRYANPQINNEKLILIDDHGNNPMQVESNCLGMYDVKDADEYDDELTDLWRSVELLDNGSPATKSNKAANSSDNHGDHQAAIELIRLALQRVEKRLQSLNSQLQVAFGKVEDLLTKNFSLRKENERLKESNSSLIQRVSVLLLEKEQLQLALSTSGIEKQTC